MYRKAVELLTSCSEKSRHQIIIIVVIIADMRGCCQFCCLCSCHGSTGFRFPKKKPTSLISVLLLAYSVLLHFQLVLNDVQQEIDREYLETMEEVKRTKRVTNRKDVGFEDRKSGTMSSSFYILRILRNN